MPSTPVTDDYLSTVLNMSAKSARDNVLPGLKATGLIDEENKVTARARRWRDDDEYAAVCEEIRTEIYPPELFDAFPGPEIDRPRLQRWFQNRTGIGENGAAKMAALFELLLEADPSKERSAGRAPSSGSTRSKSANTSNRPTAVAPTPSEVAAETVKPQVNVSPRPSLHIDIQIHISPESSSDQIEQIFKSMAKHLNLSEPSSGE